MNAASRRLVHARRSTLDRSRHSLARSSEQFALDLISDSGQSCGHEAQSLVKVESNSLSGLWGEGGRRPGEGAARDGDASLVALDIARCSDDLPICALHHSSWLKTPRKPTLAPESYPIVGAEIPDGVLVVHQGKIVAVGPATLHQRSGRRTAA